MKKVIPFLLAAALALPTSADVTVTTSSWFGSDLVVTITPSGGAAIRGVALEFETTSGDAVIDWVGDVIVTGLNTHIDYFYTNGIGMVVGETPAGEGHALANPDAAGFLGLMTPTGHFSVSAGYLDPAGMQLGQTGPITITVSYTSTIPNFSILIKADALRGGIVGDNLGTITGLPVTLAPPPQPECMKDVTVPASRRSDWEAWGKPICWCFRWQCRGDANGSSFLGRHVTIADLNLFKTTFGLTDAALATIPNAICADLNQAPFLGKRVTVADLNILKSYFNLPENSVPPCPPDNYNFWLLPSGSRNPVWP